MADLQAPNRRYRRSAATFAGTLLIVFLYSLFPQTSSAVDCNNPPRGFGGDWARKYRVLCESCGGRYNSSNQSCTPGSNWGGGSSSGSPSYDYEAERRRQEEERRRREEEERRRQRELEEERKREEEAARIRQEKFEREKQEALKGMKGIEEGGLGLKGSDSGAYGLKDIGDSGTGGLGLKELGDSGTGGLGLKEIGSAPAGPPEGKIRADLDAAARRIPELRKEIQGLQTLLRQFGAGQRGNEGFPNRVGHGDRRLRLPHYR